MPRYFQQNLCQENILNRGYEKCQHWLSRRTVLLSKYIVKSITFSLPIIEAIKQIRNLS